MSEIKEPYGCIYGLYDPRNGELRYVGQTTRNVKDRFYQHISPYQLTRLSRHSVKWIASLRRLGMVPRVEQLAVAYSVAELNALEIQWIASSRAQGARLTNHTDGGKGQKGRQHTENHKLYMQTVMAGHRTNTQEHMDMLHALRVGSNHTEETKAKISASKQGQPSAFKGRIHSEEAKAKNAAAHVGKHAGEKHPQWDDNIDTERDIIARLKTGMTATDVAKALGKTRIFVQRRLAGVDLASHGIVLERGGRKGMDQSHYKRRTGENHHAFRTDITNEQIEELRAAGLTPLAIAERLGCSETMVRGRLGLGGQNREEPDVRTSVSYYSS